MKPSYDEHLLLGYVENELSATDRDKVERWLADDPELADLIKGMRCDREVLLSAPIEEPPAWILDDIRRSMERDMLLDGLPSSNTLNRPETEQSTSPILARIGVPLSAAAVIVGMVAIASVIYVTTFHNGNDEPIGPVAMENTDREDIESELARRDVGESRVEDQDPGGTASINDGLVHESTEAESNGSVALDRLDNPMGELSRDRGHRLERIDPVLPDVALSRHGTNSGAGATHATNTLSKITTVASLNLETHNMDVLVNEIQNISMSNGYVVTQRMAYDRAYAQSLGKDMTIGLKDEATAKSTALQSNTPGHTDRKRNESAQPEETVDGSEDIAHRVRVPAAHDSDQNQPAEQNVIREMNPRGEITDSLVRQEIITLYVPKDEAPQVLESLSQATRVSAYQGQTPAIQSQSKKIVLDDEDERTPNDSNFQGNVIQQQNYNRLYELANLPTQSETAPQIEKPRNQAIDQLRLKSKDHENTDLIEEARQKSVTATDQAWIPDAESTENKTDRETDSKITQTQKRFIERWNLFNQSVNSRHRFEEVEEEFVTIEVVINEIDSTTHLPPNHVNEEEIVEGSNQPAQIE